MKYDFGNDPAKIEGYKKFWARSPVKRPLVGFTLNSWFPLDDFRESASWEKGTWLEPEMIHPEKFLDDQERLLREGEAMDDDMLRGAAPLQAIFWSDATLGCRLKIGPGNVASEPLNLSWEQIDQFKFDHNDKWFKKYLEWIEVLVAHSAGRYPVSHGPLNGPYDYVAFLRGYEQSILDLALEGEKTAPVIDKMADYFSEYNIETWKKIPLFHGGYFDTGYALWAPGSIIRYQEDAVAFLSPDLYRRYLKSVDQRIASQYEYTYMHLHSTSMIILDQLLEIPELRCLEINNDVVGPPIKEMIPCFRMVQKAGRPLIIRGNFYPDDIRLIMDSLEPAGLYLYIMINSMQEMEPFRPIVGL
jgi:hypothetical protein